MDPLSSSNVTSASFSENVTNFVKSAKGKRIVKLALSILFVAGGVTAAVVFFAVPSIALPPALAITAMAAGVIGLRYLYNSIKFAYKAHQIRKNTVVDTTPSAPSVDATALPQLKLGYQALLKKEVEFKELAAMSDSDLNAVLKAYRDEFAGKNDNMPTRSVVSLLTETYADGTLMGTAAEQYAQMKDETLKMIRFVFNELIVVEGTPTPKQKNIAFNLGTAFKSCPTERYRTLGLITATITGEKGGIPEQIHGEWNNRKMALVSSIVYERHLKNKPNTGLSYADQLPHLISYYVAKFGKALGLSDAAIAAAEGDTKKHSYIDDYSFIQDYKNQLKRELNEFLAFIVHDTNRKIDSGNTQRQPPLLNRDNLMKWTQGLATKGLLPFGFCYYSDDKDYTYPTKNGESTWIPTEDQESCLQPMMTLEEGRLLLQYHEIEIAS